MGAIGEGGAAIPPRLHYAWIIVALGHLNVLCALGFARFGYTMILPGMKEGLQLTYAETGWLATGNFVGYLVASLIAGLVASRWPPRRLILIALSCLVIGLGATSLVAGFPSALTARTFTGLASGAVYIPAMALPTLWFAPHRRGLGAGIQTGGSGLGLVLSGLLIPVILRRSGPEGWRHSWLLLAILVGVVWLLVLALLRNRPEEIGQRPYGASGVPPPPSAGPARWREVFANPGLWVLGAIYACFGFSYVIYATFFAAYLVKEGGPLVRSRGAALGPDRGPEHSQRHPLGRSGRPDREAVRPGHRLRAARGLLRHLRPGPGRARLPGLCNPLRAHRMEHPGDHGGRGRRLRADLPGGRGPRVHHDHLRRGAGHWPAHRRRPGRLDPVLLGCVSARQRGGPGRVSGCPDPATVREKPLTAKAPRPLWLDEHIQADKEKN